MAAARAILSSKNLALCVVACRSFTVQDAPVLSLCPFLERMPARLWVGSAERPDVGAVSDCIEPLEHSGRIPAHFVGFRDGYLDLVDPVSRRFGDDLRRPLPGGFIRCDVDPPAQEAVWVFEYQGDKR